MNLFPFFLSPFPFFAAQSILDKINFEFTTGSSWRTGNLIQIKDSWIRLETLTQFVGSKVSFVCFRADSSTCYNFKRAGDVETNKNWIMLSTRVSTIVESSIKFIDLFMDNRKNSTWKVRLAFFEKVKGWRRVWETFDFFIFFVSIPCVFASS